jgi:hypothetical protein
MYTYTRKGKLVVLVAILTLPLWTLASVAASPAKSQSGACTWPHLADYYKDIIYDGNKRDINYPATLHGKTVRLMNGGSTNHSFAWVENASAGDILSIDRATDPDKKNTTQKWWTSGIGKWEYCEQKGWRNGDWGTPSMSNWHVPMRVCLRHNGALQCANIWYADQT